MRKSLGILFKDTVIYGLCSAVNKSVWLIMVPVLARIFSPAEYGAMDVNIIFYTIVSTVLVLGLDSSLVRFYYREDGTEERIRLVSTIMLFEVLVLAAACAVLSMFSSDVSRLIFKSHEYDAVITLSILVVPFFVLYNFFLQLLRCRFERLKFLVLSLGATVVQVALTLYLAVFKKTGVMGVLEAILYTQVIFSIIGFLTTRKSYSLSASFRLLKQTLGFGIPSLGRSFSQTIVYFADRFFLVTIVPLHMVGIYSMGARIASVINMIVMGFLLAWSPFALSIHKQNDAKKIYSKVLTYYLLACSTIIIAIHLGSKELLGLIAPSYAGAEGVIGLLSFSYMLVGAYSIVCIGVTITGNSFHIAWPSILGSVINIIGYMVLIPLIGITGAAWSSLIANLAALVFLFFINQRYYPIDYEVSKVVKLAFVCVSAYVAGALIGPGFSAANAIMLKALIFAGYVVFLFASSVVNRGELVKLLGIFKVPDSNVAL